MIPLQDDEKVRLMHRAKTLGKRFALDFNVANIKSHLDKLVIHQHLQPTEARYIYNLYTIAQEIIPDDFDIQFEFSVSYKRHINEYGHREAMVYEVFDRFIIDKVYIIRHFPEFIISNSRKQQHTIKNLFIRAEITLHNATGFPVVTQLDGVRTTINRREYMSGYAHSHLRNRAFKDGFFAMYSKFCTGSGEINESMTLNSGSWDVDEDMFKMLLLQLDTYVRWESLEGTPHMHMDCVLQDRLYDVADDTNSTIRAEMYDDVLNYIANAQTLDEIDLDWEINKYEYKLINNDKFDSLLSRALEGIYPFRFYYKDENGNLYRKGDPATTPRVGYELRWLPYKNNKVYLAIDGIQELAQEEIAPKYTTQIIKEYVKKHLEDYATELKINQSGISKYANSYMGA